MRNLNLCVGLEVEWEGVRLQECESGEAKTKGFIGKHLYAKTHCIHLALMT